jgi:hypothetical protein
MYLCACACLNTVHVRTYMQGDLDSTKADFAKQKEELESAKAKLLAQVMVMCVCVCSFVTYFVHM